MVEIEKITIIIPLRFKRSSKLLEYDTLFLFLVCFFNILPIAKITYTA